MAVASIENIRNTLRQLEQVMPTFVPSEHEGATFGNENEYTAESLQSRMETIFDKLRGLVKDPDGFVSLSNQKERNQINQNLTNIYQHITNKQYSTIVGDLEVITKYVRLYNLEQKGLEGKYRTLITKMESQITEFKNKFDEQEEEQKNLRVESVNTLKKTRDALSYTVAHDISEAFTERYNEEVKKEKKNTKWLLGAGGFLVIAMIVSVGLPALIEHFTKYKFGEYETIFNRLSLMSVGISAAWFCASQYVRQKNTKDDYGYKAVLAKSLLVFLEKIEDKDMKAQYLLTVFQQIFQDPLRKRHDIETPATSMWDFLKRRKDKVE